MTNLLQTACNNVLKLAHYSADRSLMVTVLKGWCAVVFHSQQALNDDVSSLLCVKDLNLLGLQSLSSFDAVKVVATFKDLL